MFDKINNVSDLLAEQARRRPKNTSICFSKKKVFGGFSYPSFDFKTADERVNKFSHSLISLGVKPQDKVLFFVKPNLDFSLITFALFRIGAVPVFIDPGMNREYFFKCIEEVSPRVLIGIPKAMALAKIFRSKFKSVELLITTSKIGIFGTSIYKSFKTYNESFSSYKPKENDLAAILYTSGGTGKPKGVEYGHDIFISQTKKLKEEFSLTSEDIDIPGFPLFSFFTLAMGMKSVIPHMDFSNPSQCDPKSIVKNIKDVQASFVAGSPAIWERVANYCLANAVKLDSVKYLVMFGAPVSVSLHKKLKEVLPRGTSYTPYGATECLPVSNISGEFILSKTAHLTLKGAGVCVGKPLKDVKVKIIKAHDEIISDLKNCEVLDTNEVGEIIVKSSNVTKAYYNEKEATSAAKIYEGDNVWHRMGDVGYLDDNGLLWFCGRKKHVVVGIKQNYYPTKIESIFNQHPKILRSALVQNPNNNKPALVIERTDKGKNIEPMLLMDLKNMAQTNPNTIDIHEFYASDNFPLDIRHNIKIDRKKLQDQVLGANK